MNLGQMIELCLDNTGNDLSDKDEYESRFTGAINYAKNKIAREKYAPDYSEQVILENEMFDTSSLFKTFLKIKKITDVDGRELSWHRLSSTQIKVPCRQDAIVLYEYLPADLSNDSDELDFPESAVDPQILCFYASYQYFVAEGGNDDLAKSSFWLSLWNDGLANIREGIGETIKIQSVYEV